MKILKEVSVLGTEYRIIESNCDDDPLLKNNFGYTDYTSKKIIITDFRYEEIEIEDVAKYREQVIRHELIHAFLCESGLHENCKWHNEEMVDWLAIQAPKLQKIFKETEYI